MPTDAEILATDTFISISALPTFKISSYSRSNVPEMSVTFENGQTHEMILEPYFGRCNFIGSLKSEPGSSLAATGCLEKPGDKMHITLLSAYNTLGATYTVDYDGHVTANESPIKNQTGIKPLFNNSQLNEIIKLCGPGRI